MDAQPRRAMKDLSASDLPTAAGVYALYRQGERMYVGKGGALRDRVGKKHSGRGGVLTGSAMRRNVAEYLGIGTASDIKERRYQPDAAELDRVREWLDGCDIAWVECPDEPAAVALEGEMK